MTAALPLSRRMALALAVGLLTTAARAQDVPTFFLGDSPNKDTAKEQKNIVMRPNVDNPFYAFINNPTGNERNVIAVLIAGNGKEIARSAPIVAPPNGRAVVKFQGDKPIALSGAQ